MLSDAMRSEQAIHENNRTHQIHQIAVTSTSKNSLRTSNVSITLMFQTLLPKLPLHPIHLLPPFPFPLPAPPRPIFDIRQRNRARGRRRRGRLQLQMMHTARIPRQVRQGPKPRRIQPRTMMGLWERNRSSVRGRRENCRWERRR